MSKELEALYRLATRNSGNHRSIEEVDKDFKIIEKALKDYESIDNANPSEALECLERIDNTLCLNNIEGKLEFGIDTEEHTDCDSVIGMTEDLETIKQALQSVNILMQELGCKDMETLRKYARCGYEKLNKKYLKWEDLEFTYEEQAIKVKMGERKYTLIYHKWFMLNKWYYDAELRNEETLEIIHNIRRYLFNDLRLERVE